MEPENSRFPLETISLPKFHVFHPTKTNINNTKLPKNWWISNIGISFSRGGPVASLFAPQVEVPPTVAASEIARVMTVKLAWMIQATRKLHKFPRKRNHLNLPNHQFSGKQVFDRFHGGKMCWKLKGKWSTKKRSSRDLYRQMLLAPFVGMLESQPGYHPTRYRKIWKQYLDGYVSHTHTPLDRYSLFRNGVSAISSFKSFRGFHNFRPS